MEVYLEKVKDVYSIKCNVYKELGLAGEVWIYFYPNETLYRAVSYQSQYSEQYILGEFCKYLPTRDHLENYKKMIDIVKKCSWTQFDDFEMQGYYPDLDCVNVDFNIKGIAGFQFSLCFKKNELQYFSIFHEQSEQLLDVNVSALPQMAEIAEYVTQSSIYRLHFLLK